ncbi:hypothetical protein DMC30DRAFT_262176 [Rhodotorula diobovata]|uniref:Uncharacterized protein n=1 Tax=Rhodotorula diobovata TaxID=5288 RepID=A0A5C5FU51_9BASI|nr:hypothetical protein DMC30DRAFT_262176 [Rhodotorula diobovata]
MRMRPPPPARQYPKRQGLHRRATRRGGADLSIMDIATTSSSVPDQDTPMTARHAVVSPQSQRSSPTATARQPLVDRSRRRHRRVTGTGDPLEGPAARHGGGRPPLPHPACGYKKRVRPLPPPSLFSLHHSLFALSSPLSPHHPHSTMASTTNTTTSGGIMDTVKDAANYVSETVQEYTAGASKESNKEVAKGNTNASLGDRASAAFNAAGDKIDESQHSAKAEGYKKSAEH